MGLQQSNAGRARAFKEHAHKKKERLHKSRRSAVTFQSQPPAAAAAAAAGVFQCFVTSYPPSFPLSKRRPQHHISQTKRPGLDFCKVGGWQPHFFTLKYFTAPHYSHSPQAKLCSAKQDLTLFSNIKSFCRKVGIRSTFMLGYPRKAKASGFLMIGQLLYHFYTCQSYITRTQYCLEKRH